MRKKILIGVAVVLVLLAAAFIYMNNRNRTLSPPGSVQLSSGDLTVSLSYSRPSARGRLIFGPEQESALQPYGKYWRLGANESTEITFNKDVTINGEPLKAGTYRFYAVPGADSFEIIANSELGQWGYFEPNHELDVMKTQVPVQKLEPPVEQFTISMEPAEGGINIVCDWSDVRFVIPVRGM